MKRMLLWLWFMSLTLVWPSAHLLVFGLRFGRLPPDGLGGAAVFVPMGAVAALVLLVLWHRARSRRQRTGLVLGYLLASPVAFLGSLFSGLTLPPAIGTLLWGAGPLVLGMVVAFALTASRLTLVGTYSESLTVTPAHTEELDADTRTAIVNLCIAAHGEEDFRNLFTYIPAGGRHFLAYRGAELVGHAVVTTRWLQPQGHPLLRTAYVDAVATLPTHQGRGYGSALMRGLARGIDDYEIACLETERTTFYRRLGWEEWRGPLAGRGEDGLVPTPDQTGVMVLRLPRTPTLDLDKGLTIECQTGRIW